MNNPNHFNEIAARNRDKATRDAAASHLRGKVKALEAELLQLKVLPPATHEMVSNWEGALEWMANEFVSSLTERAAEGKSPQIKLEHGAIAYFLKGIIQEELPRLASRISGDRSIDHDAKAAQCQAINGELANVRFELAGLGG